MTPEQVRCWQILGLVAKEVILLQDVSNRLFNKNPITVDGLNHLLETPEGRDCLESFVGKFTRLQDTLTDKLLPQYLLALGEKTGAVLDNLNRADRLDLIADPERWLSMRQLRNRLVHEYVDDIENLVTALQTAQPMATELMSTAGLIQKLAQEKFPKLS
ncbi:MAG: hypothetical protein Q8N96_11545 [Methylovulum sp.]|nr:hypothetical protein [Methylovulum sp.]